jgi:hypothetical protein
LPSVCQRRPGIPHSLEESLDAARESVDILRNLAEEDPSTFNDSLAIALGRCLGTLSSRLSDVDRKDALTAIRESVEIYQGLATERPAPFDPELAKSLHNLSLRLSALSERGRSS